MSSISQDPFDRRHAFHQNAISGTTAQERRRRLALDAQKLRRTHAIEAARNTSRDLMGLEDLSFGSASESEPEPESTPVPPTRAPSSTRKNPNKRTAGPHKPTFKSWAKNLLSYAETLDLTEGTLPADLDSAWRMSVVPVGKRCLAATTTDTNGKNTILYSRVAGRALGRFHSSLPGDCLLDVIWDKAQSILWVLDTCKWRGQYIVECEADFRAFFTISKLSELDLQCYYSDDNNDSIDSTGRGGGRPLLILPCPTYSAPLTSQVLAPILSSLSNPSHLTISTIDYRDRRRTRQVTVEMRSSGVLLYVREAHYESGSTPLVNWVPCEEDATLPDGGGGGGQGDVNKLLKLVQSRVDDKDDMRD
ncbi:uncharacterized protein JCM15063_004422 [Sporobolomyces koalae]|uniref:uncharacterized protein n=1 Tax=Sporobolomyces koalae TaxID=500713 RepID=UPI003176A25A